VSAGEVRGSGGASGCELTLSEWVRDMLFAVPVVPGPGPADAAVTIPYPALPDRPGPLTEAEMQALRGV
jgi:hypothetical protein